MKKMLGLLSLVLVLFSCESEVAKEKLVFSIIVNNDYNPMYQRVIDGCNFVKQHHEITNKYDVFLDKKYLSQSNSSELLSQAAEMINMANYGLVKGIFINSIPSVGLDSILNMAAVKGTKVFTYESDSPNTLRYAYFGPNNYELGLKLALESVIEIESEGKIGILAGSQNLNSTADRVSGVLYRLEQYPLVNPDGSEIIYTNGTAEDAKEKLRNYQNENSDINLWLILDNTIFNSENPFSWEPGEVKVISCEGTPTQLQFMESGYVKKIIAFDYYELGKNLMNRMIDLRMKTSAVEDFNYLELVDVNIDNMDEWLKKWN